MTPTIPDVLKKDDFRFYLIYPNKKLPATKKWNTENSLKYNDPRLKSWDGNYGVVGGYGNLIILDFDSKEFYDEMKDKLPATFTVITAGKRLPHLYYIIQGEMIKKKPIKDENNNTICDIQAAGSGVVGPNSSIDRRFYEPNDYPIATIPLDYLKEIFGLEEEIQKHKEFVQRTDQTPEEINWKQYKAYFALRFCGVDVKINANMRCPFHDMKGTGNLSVVPNGKIYCFDCLDNLWADQFMVKATGKPYRYVNKILDLVKILWHERKK